MKTIRVRNVHDALPEAIHQLRADHEVRESRNGPVWMSPLPGVATTYMQPTERVLLWAERDANPFFHFMEALWMIAGNNDVAWPSRFNSKFGQFSDDGETFHGAYGFRWREHFGIDQLEAISKALQENPECRRQVLTMWSPSDDLDFKSGKDLPCNTQCYFQVDGQGRLHLLVSCRSNDIIWGCYGANAVHFSVLLEYMSHKTGYSIGTMTQVSFNWHGYLSTLKPLLDLADKTGPSYRAQNPYAQEGFRSFPLVESVDRFDVELHTFIDKGAGACYREPFFENVAVPMLGAWEAFKEGGSHRCHRARTHLTRCEASDWRTACEQWVDRRDQ